MIKSLSPYYKNIPWLSPSGGGTPDKYILNIYVWNSLKSAVPGVPSYEIENINPLGRTGTTKVDISKYVNNILDTNVVTNTTTSLNNGNSLVWVKTEVIYYIAGVAQTPELVEIDSAIKGYGYGLEGENPTLNNNTNVTYADTGEIFFNRDYFAENGSSANPPGFDYLTGNQLSDVYGAKLRIELPSTVPQEVKTDSGGWNDSSDFNRTNVGNIKISFGKKSSSSNNYIISIRI